MTGDQIRRLRGYLGATQAQFAQLVHTSPGTVSRWESSAWPVKPDAWQRAVLERMFNVATEYRRRADIAAGYIAAGAWVEALATLLAPGSDVAK